MTPSLTLYELNQRVKEVLTESLPRYFWVKAETSEVRENQNGHCYLEFIEKDAKNQHIVAKSRASIWANTYKLLQLFFQQETGQSFTSGLKVLVQVSVEFHELYGYSLTVHNIDPTYTLGDQAKNRALILKQLEEEGVLTLNKELMLPKLVNKVAVISSPTAAGYEDFCHQLQHNPQGYVFYTKLFPAIMQGEKTESSIVEALERIYQNQECFDAVAIIRGGGATSDLSCFDSYLLAAACAQFPLPIITGIGHERDESILDLIAHTRAKTPTAVAEFLISGLDTIAQELQQQHNSVAAAVQQVLRQRSLFLNSYVTHFSYKAAQINERRLVGIYSIANKIKSLTFSFMKEKLHALMIAEQHLNLISPENILKKGYTLTLKDNKIVKQASLLAPGDKIVTLFADGKINSEVK